VLSILFLFASSFLPRRTLENRYSAETARELSTAEGPDRQSDVGGGRSKHGRSLLGRKAIVLGNYRPSYFVLGKSRKYLF
jgi:hypothetical protein